MLERRPVRRFESLGIGSYGDKLDGDGEIVDADTLAAVADYVARFAEFCRAATGFVAAP